MHYSDILDETYAEARRREGVALRLHLEAVEAAIKLMRGNRGTSRHPAVAEEIAPAIRDLERRVAWLRQRHDATVPNSAP